MSKAIELLKEAEHLLRTEAFMECTVAERCEECITQALAVLEQPKCDSNMLTLMSCPNYNILNRQALQLDCEKGRNYELVEEIVRLKDALQRFRASPGR